MMSEKDSLKCTTLGLNEEISCCLSYISQMINSLDVLPLKEAESDALNLKMECWDLLNSSKTTITRTKNMIDTLLDVCNEWNQILNDKNNRKILKKDQIEFIPYILEEFEKYFKNDLGLKKIQNKWYNFNKKAKKQSIKRHYRSRSRCSNNLQQNKSSSILTKYATINKYAAYFLLITGVLTTIYGAIYYGSKQTINSMDIDAPNVQKYGAIYDGSKQTIHSIDIDVPNVQKYGAIYDGSKQRINSMDIDAPNVQKYGIFMILSGIAVGIAAIKGSKNNHKKNDDHDDEEEDEEKGMKFNNNNNLWISIPVQSESVASKWKPVSFNKIEEFFNVFMENMKNDNDKYYDFQRVQLNVSSITKSFQALQDFAQTLISTINAKQNAL